MAEDKDKSNEGTKALIKAIFAICLAGALISLSTEFANDQTQYEKHFVAGHAGVGGFIAIYAMIVIFTILGVVALFVELSVLAIIFYIGYSACILVDRNYMQPIAKDNPTHFAWGCLAACSGAMYAVTLYDGAPVAPGGSKGAGK